VAQAVAKSRLATYQAKRDFARTPEPRGAKPAKGASRRFVVQRHRAHRRHYDLRLEVDGVLVSWAVPKGPTLDPSARLLAVHVEDHPIEYIDFEGVIPAKEYGGGDVIVWDRGTWEPDETDDAAKAIADGELHFDLHGEKLAGRFVLVRTREDRSGKEQWLLLHKRDEYAQPGWDPEDHLESVKSGRTNDEVAEAPDALWHSGKDAAEAEERVARPKKERPAPKRQQRKRSWKAPTAAEWRGFDALGKAGTWTFQRRELKLTNLDKVLFPGADDGPAFTKRDLIRYHAAMAPAMLPYLEGRPLNMHRYPDGVDKPGFWHKAVPSHAPEWLGRWHYEDADPSETQWYFVADSPPALAWLANYGAIDLHPWTSRCDDVHRPTWAFIDIDPGPSTSFDEVLVLARLYRTALDHLGVVGRPKLTGQRGVQVWVPIEPRYTYDETRAWVETVSRAVGATVPELVSWSWHKGDRKGRARLDYTQNAINRTLVAPYSARPRAGAPVSVPLEWSELDDPDLRPDRWNIATVPERLASAGDPFAALLGVRQDLPTV
jgi:bifunctional non-homologous end joining protein LigD